MQHPLAFLALLGAEAHTWALAGSAAFQMVAGEVHSVRDKSEEHPSGGVVEL